MTKYVYLAGPITGRHVDEQDWREEVCELLVPGVVGINPLRCEPASVSGTYAPTYDDACFGTPSAIAAKNRFDVRQADFVLAYLPERLNQPTVSIGTLFELGWAMAFDKPTIVVTDDPRLTEHALVRNYVPWILPDLKDAVAVLNGILYDYT